MPTASLSRPPAITRRSSCVSRLRRRSCRQGHSSAEPGPGEHHGERYRGEQQHPHRCRHAGESATQLGEKGVVVRAEPSGRAGEVLTRMFGPAAVIRENGYFHLMTDPGQTLEINRQLMASGVGVSELRPFERSLEDVFFQLTGAKQGS